MLLFQVKTEVQQKHDFKFNFQVSEEPKSGPFSSKRPCFIPDLEPREFLMETEDSDATKADHEKNNQKKIKLSKENQVICYSEKPKVGFTKTIFMTKLQKLFSFSLIVLNFLIIIIFFCRQPKTCVTFVTRLAVKKSEIIKTALTTVALK
jgi:hypothetical protein